MFDSDYLKNHLTLGYATTVHTAQGVTADSCYAILGESTSRAMLYVAMTRGRHNNEAFLYQRFGKEADHDHTKLVASDSIHIARRDNKYSAAHQFRMILANDDRPRTMHAEAKRTERKFLPEIVANALVRREERGRSRRRKWRANQEDTSSWLAGRERPASIEGIRGASTDLDVADLEM